MNGSLPEKEIEALLKLAADAFPPAVGLKQTMRRQLAGAARGEMAAGQAAPVHALTLRKAAALAIAAAAILAITAAVHFAKRFREGGAVVWALEQAASALENVSTVYVRGTMSRQVLAGESAKAEEGEAGIGFELWARRGTRRLESGDLRFETVHGSGLIVVHEEVSYVYDANENIVYVRPGKTMTVSPWLDIAFDRLKVEASDWKVVRRKDNATGRESVFVTCSYARPPMLRSWWFQFDLQTKLPARFKQWHNVDRKGTPALDARKIVYDQELSDDLFKFEIPEGAKVIEDSSASKGKAD